MSLAEVFRSRDGTDGMGPLRWFLLAAVLALIGVGVLIGALLAGCGGHAPAAGPDVVAFIRHGESEPFWTVAFTPPAPGQHVAGPFGHGVVAAVTPLVGGVRFATLEP